MCAVVSRLSHFLLVNNPKLGARFSGSAIRLFSECVGTTIKRLSMQHQERKPCETASLGPHISVVARISLMVIGAILRVTRRVDSINTEVATKVAASVLGQWIPTFVRLRNALQREQKGGRQTRAEAMLVTQVESMWQAVSTGLACAV